MIATGLVKGIIKDFGPLRSGINSLRILGKKVAVVGGGNSGIEAAIDLAGVVDHVTVVEFLDALKADDVLLRTSLRTMYHDVLHRGQRTTTARCQMTRCGGRRRGYSGTD